MGDSLNSFLSTLHARSIILGLVGLWKRAKQTHSSIFLLTHHPHPSSPLYKRLFGTKCEKCGRSFGASDFVMRAKNKIFHLECFRCVACDKQLVPGDEFALRPDGLVCKEDHANLENGFGPRRPREENNNNQDATNAQDDLDDDDDDHSQDGDKDLLLMDERHDRYADSGESLTLPTKVAVLNDRTREKSFLLIFERSTAQWSVCLVKI